MTFFRFSQNLPENFDSQNLKLPSHHLCSEALSGYSQELRIRPPNMTAQNLSVFQI